MAVVSLETHEESGVPTAAVLKMDDAPSRAVTSASRNLIIFF